MRKAKHHKNALVTAAVCFVAYAAVFISVNANRFAYMTETSQTQTDQKAPGNSDPEAAFDEDYFNSPRVDKAMSLSNPEPYNEFYPDSTPELRSI